MSKIRNILRIIGYAVQTLTILMGVKIVYDGYPLLGFIISVNSAIVEFYIASIRKSSVKIMIKLLLFVSGLIMWFMLISASELPSHAINRGHTTLHSRTRQTHKFLFGSSPREHHSLGHSTKSKPNAQRETTSVTDMTNSGAVTKLNDMQGYRSDIKHYSTVNSKSASLLMKVFGNLSASDFNELKYRDSNEVRSQLPRIFDELPSDGFLESFKNPCWNYDAALNLKLPLALSDLLPEDEDRKMSVACLPYAYILGQPKCGTSDLFERLKRHPEIRMPQRKEIRWFTRGEFTTAHLSPEDRHLDQSQRGDRELSDQSSIFSFTNSFVTATREIFAHPDKLITVDGGPHTLWWPTQHPDGTLSDSAIPTPQIIREMQPNAKFIITLSDPVQRLYSDYHFLDDDRSVVRPSSRSQSLKSASAFHQRALEQVTTMRECIREKIQEILPYEKGSGSRSDNHNLNADPHWLRASQICAHDRHTFGKAGWGRLSIGLYVLYLEKWLEHFPPEQFLILRLEDYDSDPRAYMQRIFSFLDIKELDDSEWAIVVEKQHANAHHGQREPLWAETEALLREFHGTYNTKLADLTGDKGFLWEQLEGSSLRQRQILEADVQSDTSTRGVVRAETEEEKEYRNYHRRKADAIVNQRTLHEHNRPKSGTSTREIPPVPPDTSGLTSEQIHKDDINPTDDRIIDRHGLAKHFVDSPQGRPFGGIPIEEGRHLKSLRGSSLHETKLKSGNTVRNITLIPERFSLKGLNYPADGVFNEWLRTGYIQADRIKDDKDAAHQLCSAAFGVDLAALKYLLWDIGIPPNALEMGDANRNAFHCLSMVHTMADAHSKSQVFAVLKGNPSWLTPYIDPPTPVSAHSVLSRDIVDGLANASEQAAKWLLRAGTSPHLQDSAGYTPLHFAALGGMKSLVRFLVEAGVGVNTVNLEGRTPLHYAAAFGHAEIAGMLIEAGADSQLMDNLGVKAFDIISNPGPVSAADAKLFMNIEQRSIKRIERVLHPEDFTNGEPEGWRAGTGGWGTKRLTGYETDISCDIDQFWAHDVSGEQIFSDYLARGAPVLIRGLLEDWPAVTKYTHDALKSDHGHLTVQVSDIPYAAKFGGAGNVDMSLGDYIDEVREHRLVGGRHPWYVFRGHPIPSESEKPESLVKYSDLPTPRLLQDAFERMSPPTARGKEGLSSRDIYVNSQWALGGEGTGAPVHFHNTAWNALVYGAKKWILYPPHSMIMSNRQILDYFETDKMAFSERGVQGQSCVQLAGDVMIVPESWGHGVLNLQETVAVATEVKASLWRGRPPSAVIARLPNDNRKLKAKGR